MVICLYSADNQFGYKGPVAIDMCIFILKEMSNYYKSLSSNVYICFVDASKAFDCVNYWHLCYKLFNHGEPKLIVRFLLT